MKENWKETSAIGLKMKWCRRFLGCLRRCFRIWDDHDYSWYQRRLQGRRAGKEKEKEEKGKEKDDKVEDSGDRGTKEKERETKNNFAGDESYWAQDDWQGTETESWNDGFRANEDETAAIPRLG